MTVNRKVGLIMAAFMFVVTAFMFLHVFTPLQLGRLEIGFIGGFWLGLASFQILSLLLGRKSP